MLGCKGWKSLHTFFWRKDKSIEEKFRVDTKAKEEAERFKKKVQKKVTDLNLMSDKLA